MLTKYIKLKKKYIDFVNLNLKKKKQKNKLFLKKPLNFKKFINRFNLFFSLKSKKVNRGVKMKQLGINKTRLKLKLKNKVNFLETKNLLKKRNKNLLKKRNKNLLKKKRKNKIYIKNKKVKKKFLKKKFKISFLKKRSKVKKKIKIGKFNKKGLKKKRMEKKKKFVCYLHL
jgi:hypothetical protein